MSNVERWMPEKLAKLFPELGPVEQFAVRWQYGQLGGFYAYLAEAIARADETNREALRKCFPLAVESIDRYQREPGWWVGIMKRAGVE